MSWILPRLLTPVGGGAMLLACFLPWADVRCGSVHTTPTYWQLADYDSRLYVLAIMAVLLLILGLILAVRRLFSVLIATTVLACGSVGCWLFLWLKRGDLIALQTQMQGTGGDIGRLAADLTFEPGSGYLAYLAGGVLGMAGCLLQWLRLPGRRENSKLPPAAQV